jgi:hypothetical protein
MSQTGIFGDRVNTGGTDAALAKQTGSRRQYLPVTRAAGSFETRIQPSLIDFQHLTRLIAYVMNTNMARVMNIIARRRDGNLCARSRLPASGYGEPSRAGSFFDRIENQVVTERSLEMGEQQTARVWRQTACNLCYINCGIEVVTEGRRMVKIRGDRMHPNTKGYAC